MFKTLPVKYLIIREGQLRIRYKGIGREINLGPKPVDLKEWALKQGPYLKQFKSKTLLKKKLRELEKRERQLI